LHREAKVAGHDSAEDKKRPEELRERRERRLAAALLLLGVVLIAAALFPWLAPEAAQVTTVRQTYATTATGQVPTRTTTTVAPISGRRDASVTLALVGVGLVSIFAGAFYPSVQSITGPGGVGITLVRKVSDAAETLEQRVNVLEESSRKQARALRSLAEKLQEPPGGR
jgi:hypothetical protein